MNQEQALQILVQAVQVGQSKGAFNLNDAALIAQAVSLLVKPEETTKENIKED